MVQGLVTYNGRFWRAVIGPARILQGPSPTLPEPETAFRSSTIGRKATNSFLLCTTRAGVEGTRAG